MNLTITPNYTALSIMAARLIAQLVKAKPDCNLGLATGRTPIGVYAELVRMHREEGLSFKRVRSFNLDEYYELQPNHPQAYRRYMNEHLFNRIDIAPQNTHIPDGTIDFERVYSHCADYERAIDDAGGIDLQVLGIGKSGHVGLNEPGSTAESRTRLITLEPVTRLDAAGDFLGIDNVPTRALSMGVGTIMRAKRIILLATGVHKASVVARALRGPVSTEIPATFLQEHPAVEVLLDREAAGALLA